MKQFAIYQHPDGRFEAVKQGWSWPGFLFGAIWTLVKRLWTIGLVIIAAAFVFQAIIVTSGSEELAAMSNVVGLIIAVVIGLNGNNWREKDLLKRSYKNQGIVEGANPDAAIANFVEDK